MTILCVDPNSPAEKAGLRPGDRLLTVNGHLLRDVLDYKFHGYDARLRLTFRREGKLGRAVLRKEEGQDPGLTFENYLMDKTRRCSNKCVFCFIDQNPLGMRESIYFKDDDMRLSFLLGNYISMTNLSDEDLDRVLQMRVSPLHISVQATDPELRRRLLGNPKAGRIMEQLSRLADAGLTMDCQIVVCPGLNDGPALEKTLTDLLSLQPQVRSVSVVPVGVTRHREGLPPLNPVGEREAAAILDTVRPFGEACARECGRRVVYCADELYLRAGRPVPAPEDYDGYPQLENGVGMLALFEDEMREIVNNMKKLDAKADFTLATGLAAADFMRKMLDLAAQKCNNIHYSVYAVENRFYGSTVDVAGLVTGGDLLDALRDQPLGSRVLIPATMLRHGGDVFLDDMRLDALSDALGVPVIPVEVSAEGLVQAILDCMEIKNGKHTPLGGL